MISHVLQGVLNAEDLRQTLELLLESSVGGEAGVEQCGLAGGDTRGAGRGVLASRTGGFTPVVFSFGGGIEAGRDGVLRIDGAKTGFGRSARRHP